MKLLQLSICLGFILGFSQTKEKQQAIIATYDQVTIQKLKSEVANYQNRFLRLKNRNQHIPTRIFEHDSTYQELADFLEDGTPVYLSLYNANAAKSTRANTLNSGGLLGLQLDGQNMTSGVWDGGPTRRSHQEFGDRALLGDAATTLNGNSTHATHVSGTVAATGVSAEAKGMAPLSSVLTYDWNNDTAEMIEAASQGLLLSNHSYGVPPNNVPSWFIGAYTTKAQQWDAVARTFPFFLSVSAAGNSGNFTNPDPSTFGYDKLTGEKNSKNNLVVANAQDANIDANGNLISVNINSSSSQGPSDDLRIKPDITGNGTGLFSPSATSDTSYSTLSGTSMASPNVMGTLLLLQQHHNNLYQRFMKAATLKGLACHTADDLGNVGPDAVYGWGLMNAKTAAEVLTNNGLSAIVLEENLKQNAVYTKTVKSIIGQPLKASISWTDLPGVTNNGVLNDNTPVLVQDLDLRILKNGNEFFPWKLRSDASLPATRDGDNFVDNLEQVLIDNPDGGEYTIQVTHKGQLVDNQQAFALIVTGIDSDFNLLPIANFLTTCSDQSLTFNLSFKTTTTNPVVLSVADLPIGVNTMFSSNNLTTNQTIQLTLSNLNNVPFGDYSFKVLMTDGTKNEELILYFNLFQTNFEPLVLINPANESNGISNNLNFTWQQDPNAKLYNVQVSLNPNFENLVINENTTETQLFISDLQDDTVYYWRVINSNDCGVATQVPFYTFRTGSLDCNLEYIATDYSSASIATTAFATASVPLVVEDTFNIGNIKVFTNISHTWIQDMTISLVAPVALNNQKVTLIEEACGSQDDINVSISDAGGDIVCATNPGISGHIKPQEFLSQFNGQNAQGTWKLNVLDSYNQDGGLVNEFKIQFCEVVTSVNNLELLKQPVLTTTNSNKIINNSELLASTISESSAQQIFTLVALPEKGDLLFNGTAVGIGTQISQEDINNNLLVYSNALANEDVDAFVVSVTNNSDGWLTNQLIEIFINEPLSVDVFEKNNDFWYPNPASDVLFLSSLNKPTKVEIFDLSGRLVNHQNINDNQQNIPVSHLQQGVYLIRTHYENEIVTQKIIKK